MGSGMLPTNAYVTLEHEYILIFRKGGNRKFSQDDKLNRNRSAYFWEERNNWFSDIWMDIKGARQDLGENNGRERSAAFPFEIPYRLIHMFSVKSDVVLDPFLGTGTTLAAAMAAGRSSIGFEIDPDLLKVMKKRLETIVSFSNKRIRERLSAHEEFIRIRFEKNGKYKYQNRPYGFPVVTNQETSLLINSLASTEAVSNKRFEISYLAEPQPEDCQDWGDYFTSSDIRKPVGRPKKSKKPDKPV